MFPGAFPLSSAIAQPCSPDFLKWLFIIFEFEVSRSHHATYAPPHLATTKARATPHNTPLHLPSIPTQQYCFFSSSFRNGFGVGGAGFLFLDAHDGRHSNDIFAHRQNNLSLIVGLPYNTWYGMIYEKNGGLRYCPNSMSKTLPGIISTR